MRTAFLILTITTLGACEVASPAPNAATAAATSAPMAPFVIPMDPGSIRCSALSNPSAAIAARDWMLGQARASVLTARVTPLPDEATLTNNLMNFCASNANATVLQASNAIGI